MKPTLPSACRAIGLAASALALTALTACGPAAPVGAQERPFTMYFVPSVEADTIATNAEELREFVEEYVGEALYGDPSAFHVETAIPTSYVAVVEAFGTGRADFAALNTFSYILAKDVKGYDVRALVSIVRGEGERSYKGQVIVRADSGIETLADLDGKKFAFTDPASTAGYLLPSKLLRDNGIEPAETTFAMKHDNVVSQVYQGQVDAGATYYSPPHTEERDGETVEVIRDARARVLTQYPDVAEKVRILGFTEETPNEPWVMRGDVYDDPTRQSELEVAVRDALLAFAVTPGGLEALDALYDVTGLVAVDDTVYEDIRRIVREQGLDVEAAVADD